MSINKIERLFQYLIELSNQGSKVIRKYREYNDFYIWDAELLKLENCTVFPSEPHDVWLEVRKIHIDKKEEIPPSPPNSLQGWLEDNYSDWKLETVRTKPMRVIEGEDGERPERFADDFNRQRAYETWLAEWKNWRNRLARKKREKKIYEDLFQVYQRFEREGERLEFVFGTGMLTWKKEESIEHPIATVRMELEFLAEKGVFHLKPATNGIQAELEVLSGFAIPNAPQIQDMADQWRETELTKDIFHALDESFAKLVHLLDANGEYVRDTRAPLSTGDAPKLYQRFLFMVRPKDQRVLKRDLRMILQGIQNGTLEVPPTIQSLVGEAIAAVPVDSDEWKQAQEDLFFPLPANEDQKEIARRIAVSYSVSVQGPPGTGKSHTIANLVSHLLAHGKKVLITSQKESPLRVLRDKIPKDIQSLCVPMLGGSRDSLQEMENAINSISEKLGSANINQLTKDIEQAKKALENSRRREAQYRTELRRLALKEHETVHWDGKAIFRADAARMLQKPPVPYDWIADDIEMNRSVPISEEQFAELWKLRGELTSTDYRLLMYELPERQSLPSPGDFHTLLAEGEALAARVRAGETDLSVPLPKEVLREVLMILNHILAGEHLFERPLYRAILQDVDSGGVRKEIWEQFASEVKQTMESLLLSYKRLSDYVISLPAKPLFAFKQDVMKAKEALQQRKTGALYFLLKGKDVKYLFKEPVLNNKPVETVQEFEIIEQYIEAQEEKERLIRKWNNMMEPLGGTHIEDSPTTISQMDNELAVVYQVFEMVRKIDQLRLMLKEAAASMSLKWEELSTYHLIRQAVEQEIRKCELREWEEKYEGIQAELKQRMKQHNIHQIWEELLQALQTRDVVAWKTALDNLNRLQETKQKAARFESLLTVMKNAAPKTAQWIESLLGQDEPMPASFHVAWKFKTLHTWLHELDRFDSVELEKSIKLEQRTQQKLIQLIVAKSSWKYQLENITEEQKRALFAWKKYIKRYGKGTGKNAAMYLREAQREMAKCQGAIPVWIMPIQQVLENFPVTNEKFDVVIVDESSQCNILALPVLLRAKRAIVVGDDEQISPYDLGVKSEDVTNLVQQYLQGIPNARLFDLQTSLYDIADQTFPKSGRLMLKEHFRCVPEIIQFSNDLSYNGNMIPLRLPTKEEMLTPPVLAIRVVDGYCSEGTEAINRPEAEKIVQDIAALLKDPAYDGQTIGVIALQGNKQHELIEKMLRNTIGEQAIIERKIRCGNAYAFQGDERDVMFLSMVVAPNRRFQSLTKKNFQQIFNVAASRARNQMRLYHSVGLEDLKPEDLRHRLLSYCLNPARMQEEMKELEQMCDSPFEVEVLRRIRARGFRVIPQMKVAGRRIDLVVEGMRNRLAVECDGEKFHGIEKWEADMERQYMLERIGWTFWRVRGRDFYRDPDRALASLWVKLEEMGIEPYEVQSNIECTSINEEITYETQSQSVVRQVAPDNPKVHSAHEQRNVRDFAVQEKGGDDVSDFEMASSAHGGEGFKDNFTVEQQTVHVDSRNEEAAVLANVKLTPELKSTEAQTVKKVAVSEEKVGEVGDHFSKEWERIDSSNIVDYLRSKGLEVLDNRENNGALWVLGNEELEELLSPLKSHRITFRYSPNGVQATAYRAAWYWAGEDWEM
ncbi:AAA domain-containing protein [Anoxybacillus sp. FSL W8-0382]|uniref:AAA domain-containing protein n=1 Tax=Anoxybacillus sp. FSL W8-0382 TaxID=2954700 RepID=UPI0030F674ED